MKSELILKYEWPDPEKGFDMTALGESLIGFNYILEELFDTTKINGELEIRTIKVQEGSIELTTLLQVVLSGQLFDSIRNLYDFLSVTDQGLYQESLRYFSDLGNAAKGVHDFLNAHDFDGGLLIAFIFFMLDKQRKRKVGSFDRDLPPRYAAKLDQLKQRNAYKKTLKPLIDGGFNKISLLSTYSDNRQTVEITEDNLEAFLAEDQQILPEFQNGQTVQLVADLRGLSNTRGETIKLKIYNIDPHFDLLVAHPGDGASTEDYRELYGERVVVTAEIYRKTLYRKPELIIVHMEKQQTELQI